MGTALLACNLKYITDRFRSFPFGFLTTSRRPVSAGQLKAVFRDTGIKPQHIERLGKILKELDEFEQSRL